MLAHVTGEIESSLLARIEYLVEKNRVLRNQVGKRLSLIDAERRILARRAGALTIVKPETILRWHGRLAARKFDGSRFKKKPGRQIK